MHAVFLIAILELGWPFISHIPLPALAGVTAWMGLCLLDWSTWRRLPKMNAWDAAAFLSTAAAVMMVNAALAVAIGCSFYVVRAMLGRRRSAIPQAASLGSSVTTKSSSA